MTRNAVLSLLFTVTLFVSAALLFLVQPFVAKLVLPLLGGTPAVWNTCMVFFQAMLLLGYGYAHLTPRWLGTRRQPVLHLLLLLLPFLCLPLALPAGATPPDTLPVFWLLGLLLVIAGLPFFVVSTSAPLLQHWFSETGHPAANDPYFLYAASNLGSILALIAYPTLVEPLLPLAGQSRLWTAGYCLLIVLSACCAVALWRSPTLAPSSATMETEPLPTAQRRLSWVLLAFVPSSLMLSVTTYITTDVAAMPLLWVAPLTLYLLTFVLAFARRPWLPQGVVVRWTPLAILVVVFQLLSEATEPVLLIIALHLFGLFWIAWMCHGELARTRPPSRDLTEFYCWLSLGGVLGGLFNTLAAPLLFSGIVEYPLILILAAALQPALLEPSRPLSWRTFLAPLSIGILTAALVLAVQGYGVAPGKLSFMLIFPLPLILCYLLHAQPRRYALGVGALLLASGLYYGVHGPTQYRTRSFFGVHRVTLDPTGRFRILVHGNTVHGQQSLEPAHRREPLTYYHRTGPAGQLFAALQGDERLQRVGVIGMGTASLCAYAEPGQRWTFYEIDPAVVYIARDSGLFTFLADCSITPTIILGDARQTLARSSEKYGLLIVDAFSSDAIPTHLLTREALALYRRHLDDDGILLFNISNRYLKLEQVLANLAQAAQPPLSCITQADLIADNVQGKAPSHWVALASTPAALAMVRNRGAWHVGVAQPGAKEWRDDYSNLLGVLKWREEE